MRLFGKNREEGEDRGGVQGVPLFFRVIFFYMRRILFKQSLPGYFANFTLDFCLTRVA